MDFEIGQLCSSLSCGNILPSICPPAPVAEFMSAKHRTCSPNPEGPGALRGAHPAPPPSSPQLGPVQHPAASFPLQDQSVLPPKLCVCICNPAGVIVFQRNNHSFGGCCSTSEEANLLKTYLGCAALAKGHLCSSLSLLM